jgi:APA family basic amino acid/polyamine antiporter
MMLILVAACFAAPSIAARSTPLPMTAASLPLMSMAMVLAVVTALRAVLVTYDGWYSPVYLAEESTDPTRTMPRALIGGTLVVTALYVLINIAMLRVLPLSVLAASAFPAADAARVVLPRGGPELVTVISFLTVLSLINALLLMAPRVLLAVGRDGLFTPKATMVSTGGTPRLALAVSSAAGIGLILTGTFEQIIALSAVFFLLNYIAVYTALFVLRRREPDLPRPYRAFGFPFSTGIVWLGCVLVLLAAIIEDLRSAVAAALLLIACAPLYVWISRQRRSGGAKVLPERRESCSGAALRGQSAAPIAVHRVDQDTKERPAHEHGDRKPRQQSEQNHAADERKGSHHPDERRPK